jgi:hypothetical protein
MQHCSWESGRNGLKKWCDRPVTVPTISPSRASNIFTVPSSDAVKSIVDRGSGLHVAISRLQTSIFTHKQRHFQGMSVLITIETQVEQRPPATRARTLQGKTTISQELQNIPLQWPLEDPTALPGRVCEQNSFST